MAENDPRGAISLLAPILDPIDTTITPEQVESGDYQIPEIFSYEEMQRLPPGANFTYRNPDTNQIQELTRNDSDIPFVNLEGPTDVNFNSLPTGAYFYTSDGALRTKDAETPTLFQRGRDRLLGLDIDPKSLKVELPRIVSTITGATSLGSLGPRIPAPSGIPGLMIKGGGTLLLGGTGAAMGAIAPEQTMEWLEKFGVLPEGTRDEYGYDDEDLRTLFLGEGLLDLAFGGTLSAARVAGRPFAQAVTGISRDAAEFAKAAKQRGISMLPIQVGEYRIPRGYVAVMGRFPFFGGPFVREGRRVVGEYAELLKSVPSRLAPLIGINDLSTRIFKDARNFTEAIERDFSNAYTSIFKRADEAGVKVLPENSLDEANILLKKIEDSRTVRPDGTLNPLSKPMEEFKNFLKTEIISLKTQPVRTGDAPNTGGIGGARDPQTGELLPAQYTEVPVTLASGEIQKLEPQCLAAVDGMLARLDTLMSSIKAANNGRLPDGLSNYYPQLSNKIKADVVSNLVEPAGKNAETGIDMWARSPQGIAGQIGYELNVLDKTFSSTMKSLFETSGAKLFEGVRRGGLRGTVLPSKENLRKNVDTLASTLVRVLPQSPQTIYELKRILPDETFRMLGATYIDNLMTAARGGKESADEIINIDKLRDSFGVNNPDSPQYKAMEALLSSLRGSPEIDDVMKVLSMDELDTITMIGQKISDMEIPEISKFIARRATLGGIRSGAGGLNPFSVVGTVGTGTAAGGTLASATFGLTSLLSSLAAIGELRLISNMLVNPSTALPLKEVIEAEAKGIHDRNNMVRLIRGTMNTGMQSLGWTVDQAKEKANEVIDILDFWEDSQENPELLNNPSEEVVELEESLVPEVEETVAVVEPPPFSPMTQSVPAPPIDITQLPQQPVPVAAPPSPENRAQYAALFPNDMASGIIRSGIGSLV